MEGFWRCAPLAVLILLIAPVSTTPVRAETAAETLLSEEDLLVRLRRGGIVLVMRHQRAAMEGKSDDFSRPWGECTAQRNLSASGYAGAAETGQAFHILQLKFATVLASPMCRTMETARLTFGHAASREELGHITDARGRSRELAGNQLRALVTSLTLQAGSNAAVVTHGGNIPSAFGQALTEGEMLFFAQGPNLQPILIGRASASEFDLLANEHGRRASLISSALEISGNRQ